MTHSRRHDDLLRGLALGILTDEEVNAVSEYLESCQQCPVRLQEFRVALQQEDQTTLTRSTSVFEDLRDFLQLSVVIEGHYEAVARELAVLKGIITGSQGLQVFGLTWESGAVGSETHVVAVLGEPARREELLAAVARYLADRDKNRERSSETSLEIGPYLQQSTESPEPHVIDRPAVPESTLTPNALERFIVGAGTQKG
jgi:hypothetical protein